MLWSWPSSLYEAADEEFATGGPDLIRGICSLVATVTAEVSPRARGRGGRAVRRPYRAAQDGGPAAMTMPYYVAPEQVMKDRAEYAQKGIARGRSLIATVYDMGIAIVAENPSRSLHKISEIYDRIAFGGVGKYNEYDQLRVSGIRHADTKGYAYSREDVDARSLANLYAQYLGQVFTHEMKPLEVEILVAELGAGLRPHQLYHIAYEGPSPTRTATPCWVGRPRPSPSGSRSSGRGLGPPRGAAGGGELALGSRPDPRRFGSRGGRSGPGQREKGLPQADGRRTGEPAGLSEPGRRPRPPTAGTWMWAVSTVP